MYCTNCRTDFAVPPVANLCETCGLDVFVPEGVIDHALAKADGASGDVNGVAFGYPGEMLALALAFSVAFAGVMLLGIMSVGAFLLVLLVSVGGLWIRQRTACQHMVAVSSRSFSRVHNIAKVAAYRLQMPVPPLYVVQEPSYNAFATGFLAPAFVVVHSQLVEDFDPPSLLYVLGHEFGHLKRQHTTLLFFLEPARSGGKSLVFAGVLRTVFNVWSVRAEYTADQAGLLATGDWKVAARALLMLAAGKQVDVDLEEDLVPRTTDSAGDTLSMMMEWFQTHPFALNRIRQIRAYAMSPSFARALWWMQRAEVGNAF